MKNTKAQNRALKLESAIYKEVWRLCLFREDVHIELILDKLATVAGDNSPETRQSLRIAFMRTLLGVCWQQIESCYGCYATSEVFEQRLDAWVESFLHVTRPLELVELCKRHMAERPRMPLICDIAPHVSQHRNPRPPEREPQGSTPGLARSLYEEFRKKALS